MRVSRVITGLAGVLVALVVTVGLPQITAPEPSGSENALYRRPFDDIRPVKWAEAHARRRNLSGTMIKAIRPDSVALDTTADWGDYKWTIAVNKKVAVGGHYDSVYFHISEWGRGVLAGYNTERDTVLLFMKWYTNDITDFRHGLEVWFEPSDSIATSDQSVIWLSHMAWQ